MTELKPYNKDAICPKCSCIEITSLWEEEESYRFYLSESPKEEHISRVCSNCKYEWYEAPLDKEGLTNE